MLDVLCKLLGIREDQAEDTLRSERCARLTLSRRSLFSAALCTGAAFSFGAPAVQMGLIEFTYIPSYAEWFAAQRTDEIIHNLGYSPKAAYKKLYGAQIEEFKRSIDWSDDGGVRRSHPWHDPKFIEERDAWYRSVPNRWENIS